jgi:nucleoside-diphosphate-sugar epimerase
MNIILLGYNGLLGSHILESLNQQLTKNYNFKIICVGRNIKNKPFKKRNIRYIKWNFINFSKSKLFFLKKKNIIINCIGNNYRNSKNFKKINLIFIQKLFDYLQDIKASTHFINLSSVSVYDFEKKNLYTVKNITEDSTTKPRDYYSKDKLETDTYIQNIKKLNNDKISYTILRIANVFSYTKNSDAFNLIRFFLKKKIWFKCSNNTMYHFIHAKDVAFAVILCIFNLRVSRNKIYIVSDSVNQFQLHKIYEKNCNRKLLIITIPLRFIKFIVKYFFLPKKLLNFFLLISSEINYDNSKVKKELNFKLQYSLRDKII